MTFRRSAMLVTKQFPPEAVVGAHRTVALCRHLAHEGWEVSVLAAQPPEGCALDQDLLATLPQEVHVVRTPSPDLPLIAARWIKGRRRTARPSDNGAAPAPASEPSPKRRRSLPRIAVDWASWWLHVPDATTGWYLPAIHAGLRLASRQRPSVIFSTAPSWTAHLVALSIAEITGKPLVADFRDPWCGSRFRNMPYSAHRSANQWLERRVVAGAREITCAWEGIRVHLLRQYPHRAADVRTILNGFNPDVIDAVEPSRLEDDRVVLIHSGSFYGPRSPVPLFKALRELGDRSPGKLDSLRVVLLGLTTYNERPLEQIAREHGLDSCVRVIPRVPHAEALAWLKGADAAMLFGQSGAEELASIPAKAFEYIGAGKPVLAVGAGREACEVMRSGGCRVWRVSAGDVGAIAHAVEEILDTCPPGASQSASASAQRERFTQKQTASALEQALYRACETRRTSTRTESSEE
jgi:glycosyltransferase involved in cell wall biosynthesis